MKAVSWQILGLLSMVLIGYFFTGSLTAAGSMAIFTTILSSICYVMHERAWNRIPWGRVNPLPISPLAIRPPRQE
jgi:uncharacterized membrane protein